VRSSTNRASGSARAGALQRAADTYLTQFQNAREGLEFYPAATGLSWKGCHTQAGIRSAGPFTHQTRQASNQPHAARRRPARDAARAARKARTLARAQQPARP
jgi:hypothetical protein